MGFSRVRPVFDNDEFQYVLEVELQLNSFREYIRITEEVIDIEIKKGIEKWDKFLVESSVIDIQYGYHSSDHEVKIYTHQLYYNSIFISLYSFLEKKMLQFCKLGEKKHLIKVKDLSDKGIVKFNNYLKKVLLIDMKELNTEWSTIKKYNELRNQLVHSNTNSIEYLNKSPLIETLKSIKNLNIIERKDFIEYEITDKKLLLDFWSIINKFLHDIYYEKVKLSS